MVFVEVFFFPLFFSFPFVNFSEKSSKLLYSPEKSSNFAADGIFLKITEPNKGFSRNLQTNSLKIPIRPRG